MGVFWVGRYQALVESASGRSGCGWIPERRKTQNRKWMRELLGSVDLRELVRGIGLEEPARFAVSLAALECGCEWCGSGMPLEQFLESREGSSAMVVGRSEELSPLLRSHLSVACSLVKRKERDDDVPAWVGTFLRNEGRQIWLTPESLQSMPHALGEGVLQDFEEVILGPEPVPPLVGLYRTWGITHWVGGHWADWGGLKDWVLKGGHAVDFPGYELRVHGTDV